MSTTESDGAAASAAAETAETTPPAVPVEGAAASTPDDNAAETSGAAAAAASGAAAASASAASASTASAAAAATEAPAARSDGFPRPTLNTFETMEPHMKKAAQIILDLDKNGKWTSKGEKDGCHIWLTNVPGSSLYAVRGRTRIKRKPLWFREYFEHGLGPKGQPNTPERFLATSKKINPDFINGWISPLPGSTQCIRQLMQINMTWPATNREFCMKMWFGRYQEGTMSVAVDYDWEEHPCSSSFVRGEMNPSGYIIRPVPDCPDESDVTYVLQVDVKGSLPSWLVNAMAPRQGREVLRMKAIVEDKTMVPY